MSIGQLPYHRTRAGKMAPCGARSRPCPLAEHFPQWEFDKWRAEEDAARREAKAAAKQAKLDATQQYPLHALGQQKVARVAPAGKSSFRCPRCDRYMARGFGDSVTINGFRCPSCFLEAGIEQWEIDIQADNVKFLDDEVAAKSKWYHVTEDANWGEKMAAYQPGNAEAPVVHVGTKATSLRHAELRKFNSTSGKYLFEVKLHDGVAFSPALQEDVDYGWPSNVADFTARDFPHVPTFEEQGFAPHGATRYLNRFEGAGTISLILAPHLFTAKRIS